MEKILPKLSFGTYLLRGDTVCEPLRAALDIGYRSIDTAAVYRNEAEVGKTVREFMARTGVTREELFITSKLAPRDQGFDRASSAINMSLQALDLDYIDLFLIHWPGQQGLPLSSQENATLRQQSWNVMESFHQQRLLRSIGVSNYEVSHLKQLLATATVRPVVNQVEFHPLYQQKQLLSFCKEHGITMQAYYTFGGDGHLISHPTVLKAAKLTSLSPARVLLRWALDQNVYVIPKSTKPARIADNFAALSDPALPPSVRELLDNMNADGEQKLSWDPSKVK